MIDAPELTKALKGLVIALEDDLRVRAEADQDVAESVAAEFARAQSAGRTGLSESVWREGLLTQVAVGWVLATVFVRFCEDNCLIADALISGPGDRGRQAEDAQTVFYRGGDALGERDYLLHVFEQASGLPGLDQVLSKHNPLWLFGPSEDGARMILSTFRETSDESGALVWNFTDLVWETRFLGDLYQDLSETAKKNFALLQTPDFVESFILDRTLDPAVEEFGLDGFAMIDPSCGSGHFLLGAFDRLFAGWKAKTPADGPRANAAKALGSVNGVDINPFAAAIAKFRLLVAALKVSGVDRLSDAPVFELRVATGDSLLHAPVSKPGKTGLGSVLAEVDAQGPGAHLFATEDGKLVREVLGREYHAVVANPPYITPKDPAANAAYRERFETCHRQYSLAVPFMELIFRLAKRGAENHVAGFTGQITANSFMKREFGKKLIQEHLASEVDLSHVIDTSGAYIPGHGTPTVILFGRNRQPVGSKLRAVMGIRGEPSAPDDPENGLVWSSIASNIDIAGSENDYVSVDDLDRGRLAAHPWSLQGGGAKEAKVAIESAAESTLVDRSKLIGYTGQTNADDVMLAEGHSMLRRRVEADSMTVMAIGELFRDWTFVLGDSTAFPYDTAGLKPIEAMPGLHRWLWPARTMMGNRRTFSKKSYFEEGRPWWEWHQIALDRLKTPLSIAFAFVATHNHFVLDRGGKVFNRSAPVIKLGEEASVEDHLELLGLLNSSVACFWMKQVFYPKGGDPMGTDGARLSKDPWSDRYEFDGTKLKRFPVASGSTLGWASVLDSAAAELSVLIPGRDEQPPTKNGWVEARAAGLAIRARMQGVQEELDWRCYHLYGLTDEDLSLAAEEAPLLALGERAFEIVLARKIATGGFKTSWFARNGSTPITELPSHWSDEYRLLVERRIALIESDRNVRLCEQPEHKRRWNWDDWDDLEQSSLESWLLGRLEAVDLWSGLVPLSVAQLADRVRTDAEFVAAVEMYAGADADLVKVIGGLVADDSVPFLSAWRYKPSGLRKRLEWESTWALQRREDAGVDVREIPVPPKYKSSDFVKASYWKLRGKLDVPKERFVSYPGAERAGDGTMLIGWAGWDHLEQAQALAGLIGSRQSADGWGAVELEPLLAGLDELIPWLKHWHNDVDSDTGERLGDFFDAFVDSRCAQLGLDRSQLVDWRPPSKQSKKKAKT